jgi:hypothetical protein
VVLNPRHAKRLSATSRTAVDRSGHSQTAVLRWGYGTKHDTKRDSSGLVAIGRHVELVCWEGPELSSAENGNPRARH